MFPLTDLLFSLKAKWKLRNQWHADIDRDLIHAASKGLRGAASQLVPHASPLGKAYALWQASYQGHSDIQTILLANDGHHQAHLDGLLCRSAAHGDMEGMRSALNRGADLHNNNDLPLMLAASNGQEDATRELLAMGADVHSAFNVYTLACLKGDRLVTNPAVNLVEWAFLNPRSSSKQEIGFKPFQPA